MSVIDNQPAALQRYIDACRSRIPGFVSRHFSLRGSLVLHRGALGADLWRAPVNTLLAVPAFLVRLTACLLRCVRFKAAGEWLETRPLGLTTAVDRKVEELVLTQLLALPGAIRSTLTENAPLSRLIRRYVRTRSAASELALNAFLLCFGAVAFERLTPGSLSTGTALAQALSERTAIESFPLGTWLGRAYYSLFPVSWSPSDIVAAVAVTLVAVALLSTFVGIVADPVQAALGIHRRRLRRLVDALERRMIGGGGDFKPKDAYYARLVDLVDAARAAGTLLP